MEPVAHLWNVLKFFDKKDNPEVAKLRMHYVRCCRELSEGDELPKQNFGSGTMCPRCGSSWALTKHKTRIVPGKKPAGRINNLIRASREGSRLSKYRQTLISKCEKNRANKIVKICSVCSETAKFPLSKPQRREKAKANVLLNKTDATLSSSKKKKKRVKDRTAGLNISGAKTPDVKQPGNGRKDSCVTPFLGNKKKNLHKLNTPTPVSKPKKMNLSKLKGIIDITPTTSKKSKLHTFLQELC